MIVRLTDDESETPVFFLADPNTYENAGRPYALLFPLFSFTLEPATGLFRAPDHRLAAGQTVAVVPASDIDQLPQPLRADRRYYAIVRSADQFELSASAEPSAIRLTSAGSGTWELFTWPDTERLPSFAKVAVKSPVVRRAGEALLKGLRRHPAIGTSLTECLRPPFDKARPICLFFEQTNRPIVESFPWEALYHDVEHFLALDQRWPIVRLKDPQVLPVRTFAYDPPLRIFALLSATGPNVDATFEWEGLKKAVEGRDVMLKVLTCQPELIASINKPGDWRYSAEQTEDGMNVLNKMRGFTPQILHLFGHGSAATGELVFGTFADYKLKTPGKIRFSAASLRQLSSDTIPIWLAVMNACGSGSPADRPESLASALARSGFPVVIGMSTDVASEYTRVFTAAYYRSAMELITSTKFWSIDPIDWASKLWEARKAIQIRCNIEPDECPYWTIPLVYTRPTPFEILRIGNDDPARKKEEESTARLSAVQTHLTDPSLRWNIDKLHSLVANS